MDYEKILTGIQHSIEHRPDDKGAYQDFFSLCRAWESEDFARAHELNKHLRGFAARQIKRVSPADKGQNTREK